MTPILQRNANILACIACVFLVAATLFAGCTSTTSGPVEITAVPTPAATQPVATASTPAPTTIATTSTPVPVYTQSSGNLVVYTAASLTGASAKLGSAFTAAYPGHKVIFSLDGTQALKTKVEAGAYADVFISASNSYTTALKNEGYFTTDSVKPLTSNYLIVILPESNPGNIQSLTDLAKPGVKIAMEAKEVPAGTVSVQVIGNLANASYGKTWQDAVYKNVVTYETSEPAVATKVSLGEVDAGFVYESTYKAAPANTLKAVTIPRAQNVLQTYTIGVMKQSANIDTANDFEQFILSPVGQQILTDYGFRPV